MVLVCPTSSAWVRRCRLGKRSDGASLGRTRPERCSHRTPVCSRLPPVSASSTLLAAAEPQRCDDWHGKRLCQKDLEIRLLAQPLRQSSLCSDWRGGQISGSRLQFHEGERTTYPD